jgi:hypothetical protein
MPPCSDLQKTCKISHVFIAVGELPFVPKRVCLSIASDLVRAINIAGGHINCLVG